LTKEEGRENFGNNGRRLVSFDEFIDIRIYNPLEKFIEYRNFCAKTSECNFVGFYNYKDNQEFILSCYYDVKRDYYSFRSKYNNEQIRILQEKNKIIYQNRNKLEAIVKKELEKMTYTKNQVNINEAFQRDGFHNVNFTYYGVPYLDVVADGININIVNLRNRKLLHTFPMKDYTLYEMSEEMEKTIEQKAKKDLQTKYSESLVDKCVSIKAIYL
jgi:hypothetical protein